MKYYIIAFLLGMLCNFLITVLIRGHRLVRKWDKKEKIRGKYEKFLNQLLCKHDWVKVGWSNIGGNYRCDKCEKEYWGKAPRKFRDIT